MQKMLSYMRKAIENYNMINELDLRRPIYRKTACYGHFGREEFPWEKIK